MSLNKLFVRQTTNASAPVTLRQRSQSPISSQDGQKPPSQNSLKPSCTLQVQLADVLKNGCNQQASVAPDEQEQSPMIRRIFGGEGLKARMPEVCDTLAIRHGQEMPKFSLQSRIANQHQPNAIKIGDNRLSTACWSLQRSPMINCYGAGQQGNYEKQVESPQLTVNAVNQWNVYFSGLGITRQPSKSDDSPKSPTLKRHTAFASLFWMPQCVSDQRLTFNSGSETTADGSPNNDNQVTSPVTAKLSSLEDDFETNSQSDEQHDEITAQIKLNVLRVIGSQISEEQLADSNFKKQAGQQIAKESEYEQPQFKFDFSKAGCQTRPRLYSNNDALTTESLSEQRPSEEVVMNFGHVKEFKPSFINNVPPISNRRYFQQQPAFQTKMQAMDEFPDSFGCFSQAEIAMSNNGDMPEMGCFYDAQTNGGFSANSADFVPGQKPKKSQRTGTAQSCSNINQGPTHLKFHTYRKTEICKAWEHHGKCRFADQCSYAHGRHELVSKPDLPQNYKTKYCAQFHGPKNYCSYGSRCQYIHSKPTEQQQENLQIEANTAPVVQVQYSQRQQNLEAIKEELSSTASQRSGSSEHSSKASVAALSLNEESIPVLLQDPQSVEQYIQLFKRKNKRLSVFKTLQDKQKAALQTEVKVKVKSIVQQQTVSKKKTAKKNKVNLET